MYHVIVVTPGGGVDQLKFDTAEAAQAAVQYLRQHELKSVIIGDHQATKNSK